jgi:hypothetical protein
MMNVQGDQQAGISPMDNPKTLIKVETLFFKRLLHPIVR